MELVYFTDIFEDNHSIVRNHFVTDSLNVMENRPLNAEKTGGNFSNYQLGSATSENHGNCL